MWVARDKDGHLFIWNKLPHRGCEYWEYIGTLVHWLEIDSSLFPDLKWEDEPREVELIDKDVVYNFMKVEEEAYEEYKQEVIEEDYKIKAEGLFC